MRRQAISELLDTDSGTPAEISSALSDLRFINWAFGGLTTTGTLIERVAQESGKRSLSLLEVAAGSGYVPKAVQHRLQAEGIHLDVTLLDRAWSHLAAGHNGNSASANGLRRVAGDALALPFAENSFDLVSCNLFVHHLSPPQTVQFVTEALRVGRTAVLINDLVRSNLHLALVYAGLPLFRSRITWHDAPASVRQSYTRSEMQNVLEQTQAARIEIRNHYLFRMGAIVWKAPGHKLEGACST